MDRSTVTAPQAPARLGQPVEPAAMLRYLEELGQWLDVRRGELDELDRAALAAEDPHALTGDIMLSMALWQAVANRHGELEQVWDGGRAGQVERQRLSWLVWGRLDTGSSGGSASLAVSLPEACRLCDALAGQLRLRLSLDPVSMDLTAHLRAVRAALERLRDLVPQEPTGTVRDAAAERLHRLDRRLDDITRAAQRGADVGGLLGPLEADAALAERDLIVAAATRRDDARDRTRAQALRQELIGRAGHLVQLVEECVAQIRDAPTLAVPRVESLGPVPDDALAVDAYLVRLAAVQRALAQAEAAYQDPLTERGDLRDLLGLYHAKAAGVGRAGDPEVGQIYRQAVAVLDEVPTDLPRARAVVAAYQSLLGSARPGGTPTHPTPSGRTR